MHASLTRFVIRYRSAMLASTLLLCSASTLAAGFGEGYVVKYGHYDGDARQDLFVTAPAKKIVPVLLDDLTVPVVLCCDVTDFVLKNDGAGGFTIVGDLGAAERANLSQWPAATDLDVWYRDVDRDGKTDLEITGISLLISQSFDQIVYAGTPNQKPTGLTSKNIKYQRYHEQVFGWQVDHQYFEKNAPLVVDTVQPGGPVAWFAGIGDPTNVMLMNQFLSDCLSYVSGYGNAYTCLTTPSLPPNTSCTQSVIIYDNAGNIVGQGNENICSKPVHIVIFSRTLVTWKKDYSKYDPDARETTEILLRLEFGCPVFSNDDAFGLKGILERTYQRGLEAVMGRADKLNSFRHEPFPGDSLFNESDVTFHHYDNLTRICTFGEPNCNMSTVRDSAFRYFTYPAFRLAPTLTTIAPPPGPYPSLMAFVTSPGLDHKPNAYVLPAGLITQRRVESGRWNGASQNITQAMHVSYPGTISRYVWDRDNGLFVFTHGTGINRAYCSIVVSQYRAVNLLLGTLNDMEGPKQFGQLDKQMRKYWIQQHSPGLRKIEPQVPYAGTVNPKNANIVLP